jgi:peptidoglycan/xylan/chitin deacetylase (PgdA/CDA1 family)
MLKVVQCWDDGVVSDIRLIELLRKYDSKATFNLNPGMHPDERDTSVWVEPGFKEWSYKGFRCGKVGKNELLSIYKGFQVASHCWKHEGAGIVPDDQFLESALDARHFLEDLFQQECRGFAWPGGRYTPETCRLLREAGFAYGRTTRNSNDVTKVDDTMIFDPSCHFQDSLFWEKYEQAKQTGVFYFWGHSYEMIDSPGLWQQLEQKLKYIHEDQNAGWADVIDIVPN